MDLWINDVQTVTDYNFAADSENNWDKRMMSQAVRVNLVAGTNKVKLSLGGRNWGPMIDALFYSNLG